MFLGEFEHSLDDRGRVAIPAKFRPELTTGLVVTRGIERCLFVWPMEEWRSFSQKLIQLPWTNTDARRIHRLIFSGATDAAMDRLGRILIPAFLREYAQLRDSVMVVGLFTRLELWSHESWQQERSLAEQESAQLAEHLSNLGL